MKLLRCSLRRIGLAPWPRHPSSRSLYHGRWTSPILPSFDDLAFRLGVNTSYLPSKKHLQPHFHSSLHADKQSTLNPIRLHFLPPGPCAAIPLATGSGTSSAPSFLNLSSVSAFFASTTLLCLKYVTQLLTQSLSNPASSRPHSRFASSDEPSVVESGLRMEWRSRQEK